MIVGWFTMQIYTFFYISQNVERKMWNNVICGVF